MGFGTGCAPGPDGPSSNAAAARDGSVWPRRGHPFRSLRGVEAFRRVRRTGRRRRIGGLTVIAAEGGPGSPLVGFVAGQAVGSAVERNRAKRRLREAFARAPLRGDRDYLAVADRAVVEATFPELLGWVLRAVEEENE